MTIRRSGDDEIRLMDGTTHISLDGDGLNPSEFELTFFNSGGVEVGKYGDTSHTLEDCVLDSKLETGTVYGDTLINLVDTSKIVHQTTERVSRDSDGWIIMTGLSGSWTYAYIKKMQNLKPDTLYTIIIDIAENTLPYDMEFIQNNDNKYVFSRFTQTYYIPAKKTGRIIITRTTKNQDVFDNYVEKFDFRIQLNTDNVGKIKFRFIVLEGDYTSYPMDIPYFEGVGSTIVNGFTTVGKNLWTSENYGSHYSAGHTYVLKGYKPTYPVTLSSKAQRTISKGIHVKPNTYYTISITNCDLDISKYYLMATWYRKEEDAISGSVTTPQCAINTHSGQGTTTTFKTPSDCYYMVCGFAINYTYEQQGGEIVLYEEPMIQVEEGQTVTEFEEPKVINYTLPSPITLNKVGDVADTYDVVSGVETRRTKKIILDKLPSGIGIITNETYPDVVGFQITKSLFGVEEKYWYPSFNKTITNGLPAFDGDIMSGASPTQNEEGIGQSHYEFKFIISKSKLSSYDTDGVNKYLAKNPIIFVFNLGNKATTIQHTLIPSTV